MTIDLSLTWEWVRRILCIALLIAVGYGWGRLHNRELIRECVILEQQAHELAVMTHGLLHRIAWNAGRTIPEDQP